MSDAPVAEGKESIGGAEEVFVSSPKKRLMAAKKQDEAIDRDVRFLAMTISIFSFQLISSIWSLLGNIFVKLAGQK
jgi:hypothetical protein